jgi:allantoin racemase
MKIMYLGHRPVVNAEREVRVNELLQSYSSPGTEVHIGQPDDYPGGYITRYLSGQEMLNGLHHATQVTALVRKTVWAAENGYDAVVQGDNFDPGVEASRLAVRIPVIGVMRASLHFASILGTRIGLTVPLDSHVPEVWGLLRTYGFASLVTDVRPLNVYTGLANRVEELRATAIRTMNSLVNDGAQIIIPLGGALIPHVVSVSELEAEVSVPIMTPGAIGIRVAETCVQLGVAHSRAAYPMVELKSSYFDRYYHSED